MKWYRRHQVENVHKIENPPNCPELRPVEKYWNHNRKKKNSKVPETNKIFRKLYVKMEASNKNDIRFGCTTFKGRGDKKITKFLDESKVKLN